MHPERGFTSPEMDPRPIEEETRGRRAEVMLGFLNTARGIGALEGKTVLEAVGDDESKREFIERLSPSQFTELLNGANGILRDKNKTDWHSDGENVVLRGFTGVETPPDFADKENLLAEAWKSAQGMIRDGRDMHEIAALLAVTVNAVHPFNDGNGRTSRLVFSLLNDNTASPEYRQLLAGLLDEDGRERLDITPVPVCVELDALLREEIGMKDIDTNPHNLVRLFHRQSDKLEFAEGVSLDDVRKFQSAEDDDGTHLMMAIFKFLRRLNAERISRVIREHEGFSTVVVEKLVKEMSPEEVGAIMTEYRSVKRQYVEKLIDCIAHPDKPEYVIGDGEQRTTLKDKFMAGIVNKQI